MPSPSIPDHEQKFIERLRAIWKDVAEIPEPPPETVDRAKALFRQHQKAQRTRRLLYLIAFIIVLALAGVLLFFLRSRFS